MITTRLAAIYSRVSTEEQSRTSGVPSTKTQVQLCREKAKTLGIPVADDPSLVVEETHSGSDLRWVGTSFMRLVQRAQQGDFTDLICMDVDRFCRGGVAAYFEQEGYFKDAGVSIHYVHDDIPADMPFRSSIIAARADAAQWMKDKLREASVRVRTANAAKGEFIPGKAPPFGWESVEDPHRVTRKDKPMKVGLRPHPEQSAILLAMYEHVAAGNSVWSLANTLDAQGVPTPGGAAYWRLTTIRHILKNPTNWGERRSFLTKSTPRDEGVRRKAGMKTAHYYAPTAPAEQYVPTRMAFTPIPGLTKDLALRALAQLGENQANARRRTTHSEDTMAARGLLWNGRVRCAVCGYGAKMKRTRGGSDRWMYRCDHSTSATHRGEPMISVLTSTVDGLVWDIATQAMRDPGFFERVVAKTDAVSGVAVRLASLERQLETAEHERERIFKQLRRFDPDNPDDAPDIADYQTELRRSRAIITELTAQRDAARAEATHEQARRASLDAFRDYAASQRAGLDQKTPLERRQVLLALHTRVRMAKVAGVVELAVVFDTRALPGAAEALGDPQGWVNFDDQATVGYVQVQTVRSAGEVAFAPVGDAVAPAEWQSQGFTSENAYLEANERQLDEQAREYAAYQQWLAQSGRDDSDDTYSAWQQASGREVCLVNTRGTRLRGWRCGR